MPPGPSEVEIKECNLKKTRTSWSSHINVCKVKVTYKMAYCCSQLFIYVLKASSPINRTGSPQGFFPHIFKSGSHKLCTSQHQANETQLKFMAIVKFLQIFRKYFIAQLKIITQAEICCIPSTSHKPKTQSPPPPHPK